MLLFRMRCTDCAQLESTVSLMASCPHVHGDDERSALSGSSQASFTRWAATPGGKPSRAPRTRPICESFETVALEAHSPLADDLARQWQLRLQPHQWLACRQPQNHLRTQHFSMGRGQRARSPLQLLPLAVGQHDSDRCRLHPAHQHRMPVLGQLLWVLSSGELYLVVLQSRRIPQNPLSQIGRGDRLRFHSSVWLGRPSQVGPNGSFQRFRLRGGIE